MANLNAIDTKLPDAPVEGVAVDNTLTVDEGDTNKEDTEATNTAEPDDSTLEKTKRQSRLDRRFKDLTHKVRSAASDAQAWRETLAEVTGQEPPNRTDFEDQDDYFSAIEDYREAIRGPKTMLQQAEKEQVKAQTELQATLMDKWDDKVADVAEEFPNFQAVVSSANLPISDTLQTAILKHKEGPRIVYYLATHLETALELVSLPIDEQIQELSKIASRKVQSGRNVVPESDENEDDSPNPPPSKSVRADVHTSRVSPEKMSLEEFIKWRKAGGGK